MKREVAERDETELPADLWRRGADGDREACARLAALLKQYCLPLLLRLTKHTPDAEDVFQDYALYFFRSVIQKPMPQDFGAYVRKGARMHFYGWAGRRRNRAERDEVDPIMRERATVKQNEIDSDGAETLEREEISRALNECIRELPPDRQELLRRRYFLNQTFATMAHALGIKLQTLYARLGIASEKVAHCMRRKGYAE